MIDRLGYYWDFHRAKLILAVAAVLVLGLAAAVTLWPASGPAVGPPVLPDTSTSVPASSDVPSTVPRTMATANPERVVARASGRCRALLDEFRALFATAPVSTRLTVDENATLNSLLSRLDGECPAPVAAAFRDTELLAWFE